MWGGDAGGSGGRCGCVTYGSWRTMKMWVPVGQGSGAFKSTKLGDAFSFLLWSLSLCP